MRSKAPYPPLMMGQLEQRFLATAADTRGAMSMFELSIPKGARVPPPHYHEAVEEVVYCLAGVLAMTVDGLTTELHPGDSLLVPSGATHEFVNHGDELVRMLTVQTPGTIGPAYYEEMVSMLDASQGPPNPAMVKEIMGRHGLVPVARPQPVS